MQKEPFPQELFILLAKLIPRIAVELVIPGKANHEVLLTQREPDDPYWPSLWHFPGGYVWYREPIAHALSRIAKRELRVGVASSTFLGWIEFYSEKDDPRGHTISFVFQCETEGSPKEGKSFALDNLPSAFIHGHNKIAALYRESLQ